MILSFTLIHKQHRYLVLFLSFMYLKRANLKFPNFDSSQMTQRVNLFNILPLKIVMKWKVKIYKIVSIMHTVNAKTKLTHSKLLFYLVMDSERPTEVYIFLGTIFLGFDTEVNGSKINCRPSLYWYERHSISYVTRVFSWNLHVRFSWMI